MTKARAAAFMELGLCLALVVLYTATAYDFPSIEDSGEFTLSAAFLGISHPPGYPLFTLLGHVFSCLPFASLASRIHFMTSLFAAGSLCLLGRILAQLAVAAPWRAFVMLLLGLSPIFWSQAITAEVYMLNLLLFSAQLRLALHLVALLEGSREGQSPQTTALAFGLVWGLSLANHWPLAILGGAGQACLFWQHRSAVLRLVPTLVAGFILGLAPYLHLWWAPHYSEFLFSGPLDDINEFLSFVFRREYAQLDANEPATWIDTLAYFAYGLQVIATALLVVLVPIAVVGALALARRRQPLVISLSWALLGSNLILQLARPSVFNSRGQELLATIQLVPLYSASILLALGLAALAPRVIPQQIPQRLAAMVAGLLLLVQGWYSAGIVRLEHDSFARDWAYMVLDSLPTGAMLLTDGDADAGALSYAHFGEGRRPDLLVRSQAAAFLPQPMFDRYTDFANGSYLTKKAQFIEDTLKAGRRVFTVALLRDDGAPLSPKLGLREYGMLKELVLADAGGSQEQEAPKLSPAPIKEFLTRFGDGHYGGRWLELRHSLVGSMCHSLLLLGERHPLLDRLTACKHIEALYLHVSRRDYQTADRLFLELFADGGAWDARRRSQVYKEFLVNRIALLRTLSLSPELMATRYQEMLDTITPSLLAHPFCTNKVALNYYEIALQLPMKVDWDFYNATFAKCTWAQQLKKYL